MRRVAAVLITAAALGGCGTDEKEPDRGRPATGATETTGPQEPAQPPAHTSDPERLVTDLRRAGFFRGDEPPGEVAKRVLARYADEWGEPLELRTLYDELAFASYDHERVWWSDLEADALPENDIYISAFDEWAEISRGAFRPSGVEEDWQGELGPVTISFELNGVRHHVEGAALDAWIDPCVLLDGVNGLIEDSGRQFVMHEAFDQTGYILAVTARERATLERYGWRFADASEAYGPHELGGTTESAPPDGCRT